MNNLSMIITVILAFIVGFVFSIYLIPEKEIIIREPVASTVKIDTFVKVVRSKPIILEKIKTKIVKKRDTVIKAVPFTASIDTLVHQDTVKATFDYPENLFSLNISSSPDSLEMQKLLITKMIKTRNRWWETPAYVATGTILGYVLASSFK